MDSANIVQLVKSISILSGYSLLVWYVFFKQKIVLDSKSRLIFIALFVLLLLKVLLSVAGAIMF